MSSLVSVSERNAFSALQVILIVLLPNNSVILVSMFRAGCVVGGIMGGILTNCFGPRKVLIILALPASMSWMPIIFATSATELIIGRFLFGMFCSIGSPASMIYTAETVSPHLRGFLLSLGFVLLTLGMLLAYAIGHVLRWYVQAAIHSVIPLLLFTLILLPESPRWLVTRNRPEEAKLALQKLRSKDCDITYELKYITQNVKNTRTEKLKQILKFKYLKPLFIIFLNTYFLDFNGYFFMTSFMVFVFKDSGGMPMDEGLATVLVGIFQLFGTVASGVTLDRYGRRVLLKVTLLIMGIAQAFLVLYYYLLFYVPSVDLGTFTWVPLMTVIVSVTVWILGIGNIHWVLMAELFPVRIRSVVTGISVSWNSVLVFIVLQSFFSLKRALTLPGIFLFSSINCFVGVAFIHIFLPETRNMSLEQIETLWD